MIITAIQSTARAPIIRFWRVVLLDIFPSLADLSKYEAGTPCGETASGHIREARR